MRNRLPASKQKEQADRVYYCTGCRAQFSGRGCIMRVQSHEDLTGHKMMKPEQAIPA